MFVEAIEKVAEFTRPIHTISRNYGSDLVSPGAATIFMINPDGWALTCAHVARLLPASVELNKKYGEFKKELVLTQGKKNSKRLQRELELKYELSKHKVVELKNVFVNCIRGKLGVEVHF